MDMDINITSEILKLKVKLEQVATIKKTLPKGQKLEWPVAIGTTLHVTYLLNVSGHQLYETALRASYVVKHVSRLVIGRKIIENKKFKN